MIKHRKRFVTRKKKKHVILKCIVFLVIIYILYVIITGMFYKLNLASSNQEFIERLLHDSNHHILYEKSGDNLFDRFLLWVSNVDLENPTTMLENTFGYKKDNENVTFVYHEDSETVDLDLNNYIQDPNPVDINNPRVYIYNTHQLEAYSSANFEEYNITPNVMMASYLLKEKLNKLGISTMVETSNITDFLSINGWDYASSYKASRFYMLDAVNKYNSLELLIDLHRDAINKNLSTVEINGKSYAKVLFVVGLDYENYEPNLNLANKLNEMIKLKYPGLSRGVMKKKGSGVNGIYNQDVADHVILIECGGMENSIEEVMNTVDVLSTIIYEYLGDTNES